MDIIDTTKLLSVFLQIKARDYHIFLHLAYKYGKQQ